MGKSPFEICYGFQPSTPIDLISSLTQSNDIDFEGREVEKALNFRDQIYNIQKKEQEMLQQENAKAKAPHDKHHIPHSFQIGYQVWLHLKKERFTGPYRKMKPLQYGPYSILKQIGENTFKLDIHAFLGLHLVFNVDLLRPYHAPLLEQNDLQATKPEDIHPDVQEPLLCDTIVG